MIGIVLGVYLGLISHYREKWRKDKIDDRYSMWEKGQEMRAEFGFDEKTLKPIPKRKIRNKAARKKHGY